MPTDLSEISQMIHIALCAVKLKKVSIISFDDALLLLWYGGNFPALMTTIFSVELLHNGLYATLSLTLLEMSSGQLSSVQRYGAYGSGGIIGVLTEKLRFQWTKWVLSWPRWD